MSSDPKIAFSFCWTKKQWLAQEQDIKSNVIGNGSGMGLLMKLLILALLVMVTLTTLANDKSHLLQPTIWMAGFVAFCLVGWPFLISSLASLAFSLAKAATKPESWLIDKQGVHVESFSGKTELPWAEIKAVRVHSTGYWLDRGKHLGIMVPRFALEERGQLDSFLVLMRKRELLKP